MWYRDSDVVSYTSIRDNHREIGIIRRADGDAVEIMNVVLDILCSWVKGELFWEGIYKLFP